MSPAQDFQRSEAAELEAQWLVRQGALVLGPVPGRQVVDKLFAGELTADTAISVAGQEQFRRLGDVGAFRVPAAKATVKARVESEARAAAESLRRQQLLLVALSTLLALVLAGAAGWAGHEVALRLPRARDEGAQAAAELPVLAVARGTSQEQLFSYGPESQATPRAEPDPIAPPPTEPKPAEPKPAEPKPEPVASARQEPKATSRTPPRRKGAASSEPDGLETQANYDQEQINRVVNARRKSLFPCLQEEAQRRPGFSARIPIEFTIGNDGRVASLWVDHPELKKGPLYDCMLAELRKWPFKPYEGERASVSLSFTVGKPR
jgi:outer membrane biosynthesis protein TonB